MAGGACGGGRVQAERCPSRTTPLRSTTCSAWTASARSGCRGFFSISAIFDCSSLLDACPGKTFLRPRSPQARTSRYAETPLGWGESFADFSYRVPGLRDWLTFYGEAFSKDEVSPIAYIRKSVAQGGLYFARLPKLPRLDLRLEGGYTNPVQGTFCTSCFYTDAAYPSGYTNDGRLMGSWIGRAAQGELIRTNYWLSPRKKIGLELRHRTIDSQYLPGGGNQNDVALNADIFTASRFRFTGNLQYERWLIPLLAPNRQTNVSASFELGFWPTAHAH